MTEGMLFAAALARAGCLLAGYACGCLLTAETVARQALGASAFDVGSGNPGMANIAALLGVGPAALVLAGDILKTVAAVLIGTAVVAPGLGAAAVAWAGLGAALGHNFPFWHRFRGGKGVTVTCSAIVLIDPLGGFASLAVGLAVVLASKQLSFGALAIVATWCVCAYSLFGAGEVFAISLLLAALMLLAHGAVAWRGLHGGEPETDLLAALKR